MRYPAELVLKVNEVYHDVEGSVYADLHPDIFQGEVGRWDHCARQFVGPAPRPLRVLDIGCGTGFVADRVAPVLAGDDTLVCADLSQTMVDHCQRTLPAKGYACRFEFAKLDGRSLGQPDRSVGVVTVNAVLHHVPDLKLLLEEVDRVLQPGGLLAVGHEPNKRFYQSLFLRTNARLIGALVDSRQTAGAALRRLGVMRVVHHVFGRKVHRRTLAEVNRRLLSDKIIDRPLTQDQLTAIVDIHSPTAGGFHPDRGIDVAQVCDSWLPGYAVERTETYDHLGSGVRPGRILVRYDAWLAARYPDRGATLMAVFHKPGP